MPSLTVYEKSNCMLCLQPSARNRHGTTPAEVPPYITGVFTKVGLNVRRWRAAMLNTFKRDGV